MFTNEVIQMLIKGVGETLYMTLFSTFLGYLFGLPMGVLMVVTNAGGIRPNKTVYKVLDITANLVRSVPFLIVLILIKPVTSFIVGRSYGSTAMVVPLVVSAIPFIGRMVESSLSEVDTGVIEAAKSMGAGTFGIIWKVLLVESRNSLIIGVTISLGTILGYSAMAGIVGGGGLGDIASRYGYYRYELGIMVVTVVLLVLLVQIMQTIGMHIAKRLDRRR